MSEDISFMGYPEGRERTCYHVRSPCDHNNSDYPGAEFLREFIWMISAEYKAPFPVSERQL